MRFFIRGAVLAAVPLVAGLLLGAAHTLPAKAQQPPTSITVIGAPVSLYKGCNTFVVRAPLGTSWRDIVARLATPSSVVGMWRYDNPSQRYEGVYFSNSEAPTNGATSTIAFTFAIWTCVNTDGSVS